MINSKVYIVIINYNNWEDTIECLESLLNSSYNNFQIIVVDNRSENDSLENLKKWADGFIYIPNNRYFNSGQIVNCAFQKPIKYSFYFEHELFSKSKIDLEDDNDKKLILIQTNENRGFAAGNNVGFKYALLRNDFDSIILLNNDTVVHPEAISELLMAKQKYGNCAIYGGRIFYYNKPDILWYDGGYFNEYSGRSIHLNIGKKVKYFNKKVKEVNFITFCYVLIPKYVIDNAGLLDERYFMYNEDLDYCIKVHRLGFKQYYVSDSMIWHKIGSSHKGEKSEFEAYWIMRSKIQFIFKNLTSTKRIFALSFIIVSRVIRFPEFFFKKKSLIIYQIKGFIDGFKNKHL